MTVQIERVVPVLPVRDVRAALVHYRRLGFEATAYDDTAADPGYGFLSRDGVSLHLARVPDLDPATSTAACYLYVSDADTLHAAWQAAGVRPYRSGRQCRPRHAYGFLSFGFGGAPVLLPRGVRGWSAEREGLGRSPLIRNSGSNYDPAQ